jgi:hypothetical protein
MTDTATQTAEAPATEPKAKSKMPTYNVQKVQGGLPDNAKSGRADLYFNLLQQVTADPGEWYEIAHFTTSSGATNALKAIKNKERKVPDGDWEFETRRVDNPDIPGGQKHSKLFARFMG